MCRDVHPFEPASLSVSLTCLSIPFLPMHPRPFNSRHWDHVMMTEHFLSLLATLSGCVLGLNGLPVMTFQDVENDAIHSFSVRTTRSRRWGQTRSRKRPPTQTCSPTGNQGLQRPCWNPRPIARPERQKWKCLKFLNTVYYCLYHPSTPEKALRKGQFGSEKESQRVANEFFQKGHFALNQQR